MPIAELYNNAGTSISTTEISLVTGTSTLQNITTDGIYQLFIDMANMTVTEQYQVRVKEKVTSGGTQRTVLNAYFTGAQPGPYVSPSLILMHGWDMTLIKLAGTDRSFSWSIRQVA